MNAAVSPPLDARKDSEARSRWLLFGALALSGLGHVITLLKMPSQVAVTTVSKPIEIEMKFIEPPQPKPEPPPEPVKPPPKTQQVKVAIPQPKPVDAPPPPSEEAPPDDKPPPPVVIGITLDNTNAAGSFATNVGNTTMGVTSKVAVDPSSVKNYRAPKYVPAGGADTDPEVIGDVKIAYPDEAKRADVEGPVRLKITVDFEGHVSDVVVMSGPGYGLDQAAAAAMRRFKFKPALKNGEAVSTTFVYTYRFMLD